MVLPKLPFRVEIELLNVCNLDCINCYAKPFDGSIPPYEDVSYLIKKTKKEVNPFELILLGGEPFIRKDIVKLLDLCKENFNGSIGISTNGTLLTRLNQKEITKLREISTSPIIQVSIDSTDYNINDLLRGKTEKVLEGINFLNTNEIPFTIGIVMSKINLKSIETTIRNFSKLQYLKAFNLEELQPAKCVKEERYNSLCLSAREMIDVTEMSKSIVNHMGRKDISVHGFSEDNTNSLPLFYENDVTERENIIQVVRAGVLANGNVTPGAISRDIILGNLYKESWSDIWKKGVKIYEEARNKNIQKLKVMK